MGERLLRSAAFQRATGSIARGLIRFVKWLGRERADRLALFIVRAIGPLAPENRTAKRNIAAAFPEKSDAERATILSGCWENLAKVAVEFIFLEEVAAGFDPDHPDAGSIIVSGAEHFHRLRDDDRTAVIFVAHLANWEVLGVVATRFGMRTVLPYRALANVHVGVEVIRQREALMGQLVPNRAGAALQIGAAMDGGAHLGMLIDQRVRGVTVPFFGRPAKTSVLAARLARQFDCPVHGARAVRLPGGRLLLDLTPPVEMPRDAEGLIDVEAATARMTAIVEEWVREHPEQYFWLHDRWR